MNSWFLTFSNKAKYVIANAKHFVGFIAVVLIWFTWAATRGFDPFSQLVLNTPTTAAEYAFEILILASAIAAERKGEEVLENLIGQHETIIKLEQHIVSQTDRAVFLEEHILKLEELLADKLEVKDA